MEGYAGMSDRKETTQMTLTPEQIRLVEQSWLWFEKACEAFERGDRHAHNVARLAHSMISAAYKETLRA